MKFRSHKYEWAKPFTSVRHQWSFRGPAGGVSFHASIQEDHRYPPSCGLEFHHNAQPHGDPRAADHSPCWLTGQPCWHDGTSLYASETLWPMIEQIIPDHETIFRFLEQEYEGHFEGGAP